MERYVLLEENFSFIVSATTALPTQTSQSPQLDNQTALPPAMNEWNRPVMREGGSLVRSVGGRAGLGVVLSLISLVTLGGNLLVILAVTRKKYLRNPTGYLIISMAVADLMIGLLVMPFAIMLEMTEERRWPLGLGWCDVWHCLDILGSTASIWNLSVISLDRYFAISSPLNYWERVTTTRALISIAIVWVLSILISFPAIGWWRAMSPELYLRPERCEMTNEPSYVIPASLLAYYLPLALTLFAYGRIFLIAIRYQYSLKQGKTGGGEGVQMRVHRGGSKSGVTRTANGRHAPLLGLPSNGATPREAETRLLDQQNKKSSMKKSVSISSEDSEKELSLTPEPSSGRTNSTKNGEAPVALQKTGEELSPPKSFGSRRPLIGRTPVTFTESLDFEESPIRVRNRRSRGYTAGKVKGKKRSQKFSNEKRAAKTLGVVVGMFVLCWLPFFLLNILLTLCPHCLPRPRLSITTVTWLGYVNSALNPLIYGSYNRQFRQAFREILCCKDSAKEKARSSAIRYAIQQSLALGRNTCAI